MAHTTIIRSWPAIGLGAFFAGVTGYVLFEDVVHGSPITTGHLQTAAAAVISATMPISTSASLDPSFIAAHRCNMSMSSLIVSTFQRVGLRDHLAA